MKNQEIYGYLANLHTPDFKNESLKVSLRQQLQTQIYKGTAEKTKTKRSFFSMPVFRLSMASSLALVVIVVIGLVLRFSGGTSTVTITAMKGEVTLWSKSGNEIAMTQGMQIKPGQSVKTGSDGSTEMQSGSASKIFIGRQSNLALNHSTRSKKDEEHSFFLNTGTIDCDINLISQTSSFSVVTDTATIHVTGTIFSVNVDSNNNCTVAVEEGVVIVNGILENIDWSDIPVTMDTKIKNSIQSTRDVSYVIRAGSRITIPAKKHEQWNSQAASIIDELKTSKNGKPLQKEEIDRFTDDLRELTVSIEKELNYKGKEETQSEEELQRSFRITTRKTGSGPFEAVETATSVLGNNLLISSDSTGSVTAINIKTAETIWEFTHPELHNISSPATSAASNILLCTPENLFILKKDGSLIGQEDIDSGTIYWGRPVNTDDQVFIPTTRTVINYHDNQITELDSLPLSNGQIYITVTDSKMYANYSNDMILYSFDIKTGKQIWKSAPLDARSFNEPLTIGNMVYVCDVSGTIYAFRTNRKKAVKTGKLSAAIMSNIVVIDTSLYAVASDGWLYRIDSSDVSVIEKICQVDMTPDPDAFKCKYLTSYDSLLLFASDTGSLFVYDTESKEEEFVPLKNDGSPLIGTPLLIKEKIVIINSNGQLSSLVIEYN